MMIKQRPATWWSLPLVTLGLLCGCDQSPQESAASTTPTPPRATVSENFECAPRQPNEFTDYVAPTRPAQTLRLESAAIDHEPTLDGHDDETVWDLAQPITTHDYASQRPITLRAAHTHTHLFFLVTFPDTYASTTHRSWCWDATQGIYLPGNDREDVFCFKWSMSGNDVSLSFRNAQPHKADVWFWKACRTNGVGYVDDKYHLMTTQPRDHTLELSDAAGNPLYFSRHGDQGQSAYRNLLPGEFAGQCLPKYATRTPNGSRADIPGKGVWENGRWTIELKRPLDTGHDDDLSFQPGGTYLFTVSCYEQAGTGVNQAWSQPLYRTGDGFDRILLSIP